MRTPLSARILLEAKDFKEAELRFKYTYQDISKAFRLLRKQALRWARATF